MLRSLPHKAYRPENKWKNRFFNHFAPFDFSQGFSQKSEKNDFFTQTLVGFRPLKRSASDWLFPMAQPVAGKAEAKESKPNRASPCKAKTKTES